MFVEGGSGNISEETRTFLMSGFVGADRNYLSCSSGSSATAASQGSSIVKECLLCQQDVVSQSISFPTQTLGSLQTKPLCFSQSSESVPLLPNPKVEEKEEEKILRGHDIFTALISKEKRR